MRNLIVYPNNEGGVSVIIPNTELGLPIEQIARKDVTAGMPYLIVDEDDLPPMGLQHAWEADFSTPDGYGIGSEAWFAEQTEKDGA